MKYLGLIKYFNNEKGFGIIASPAIDVDIFIHISNFVEIPSKLEVATSIVFEVKSNNRGVYAINAKPPKSFNDFRLILSYIESKPLIGLQSESTVTNRWGKTYIRKEHNSYNIFDHSLEQLINRIRATDIYEFFMKYFNDIYLNSNQNFAIKYIELTKEKIFNTHILLNDYLKLEFDSLLIKGDGSELISIKKLDIKAQNVYLIQKLITNYFEKFDDNIIFYIWKNKVHAAGISSYSFHSNSIGGKIYLNFNPQIFIQNFKLINSSDFTRMIHESYDDGIIQAIIAAKILSIESICKNEMYDILKSLHLFSERWPETDLWNLLSERLALLMCKEDFSKIEVENGKIFDYFVEVLENKANKLDRNMIINNFNKSISDETKFELWKRARYFNPNIFFIYKYLSEFSLEDFISAPCDFHLDYFFRRIKKLGKIDSVEKFCLLTFYVVETPCKIMQIIFPQLNVEYQAAYWLNFPKEDSYRGQYYQADYVATDIPFKSSNFITYLLGVENLHDLMVASELTIIIQERYRVSTSNYSNNEGFIKLGEQERKSIIHELLSRIKVLSNVKLVELFKISLSKSTNEDCVSLCKTFIPKFINEDVICLDDLIKIISNLKIDFKFRQEIISHIIVRATKFERVSLWLNGYATKVEFNEVLQVFDKFQLDQQPNLLRKLFYLIQRNKAGSNESCLDQLSILATNQNLNLDVRICLAVIDSLNTRHDYIGENIISEIVCQYVNENVTELISVNDLLQECRGRTWMTVGDEAKNNWFLNIEGKEFKVDNDTVSVNGRDYPFDKEKRTVEIEGETYSFRWSKKVNNIFERLYDKPIGITFCDAVKSQMDETLNRHFYWCCNNKCYSPCQTDHIHLEWSKYSLRDFIKILKLPFEDEKYYRFVSVVNRANRLIKKLKCTSCNNLLRDQRSSEFAFYRVTTFHCTNLECSKLHEVVYLNHCLNWRCLNVVDSRISVECPNGWYICDLCGNCCSQDKLIKRLANLIENKAFNPNNPRHQKLKYQVDNNLGHMEREEKYDHITGERMRRK